VPAITWVWTVTPLALTVALFGPVAKKLLMVRVAIAIGPAPPETASSSESVSVYVRSISGIFDGPYLELMYTSGSRKSIMQALPKGAAITTRPAVGSCQRLESGGELGFKMRVDSMARAGMLRAWRRWVKGRGVRRAAELEAFERCGRSFFPQESSILPFVGLPASHSVAKS
jgi:hypothetical protein